jgi:fructoselysine 3-epimerase
MMKISTATSVFVNFSLEDAVEHIIKAGFDGVDLWCGRPHLYRKDYSPEALKQLKNKLEAGGLSPVSLMPAFFRYPFSLSSPSSIIREDSISYVKDCIDNACFLGAKFVLVVPSIKLNEQTIEDSRRLFTASLAKVCEYAEQKGMKLGVEVLYPKLSAYMCLSDDAVRIIRELGSKSLGIVLDSGHLNLSGEDTERALDHAGDLLFQMHINDNDQKQQQNAVPGEGTVNFARLINLLRSYRYDDFLTLELGWHYSFDPVPVVNHAIAQVRSYL